MQKKFTDLFTTIASSIPKLSLAVLLIVTGSSPAWSQENTAEIIGRPTVEGDRVTVRIRVKDANDKPVMGLQETNFNLLVDNKPLEFRSKDWRSPEESIPPPAWIIVLVDYSGSMNEKDSSGTTRKAGAIEAMRQFVTELGNRRCPIGTTTPCPEPEVSIVPFGDPGGECAGNPVDDDILGRFFKAKDYKLIQYITDYLPTQPACASTNIYDPLSRAIKFLGNEADPRFALPENNEETNEPEPRLSVVVLSDGYHNKPNEERDFKNLLTLLKRNDQIIVHTLGYGLTPNDLGAKYKLGRPATRNDLVPKPQDNTPVPEGKVPEEEFVDQARLAEIAKVTGGIAEFSPNAQTVAENLRLFLNALLGEYQISYQQPNAERGSKHDVGTVITLDNGSEIKSTQASYTIPAFSSSLPLKARLIMLLLVFLLLGLGGILPFWLWGNKLKQEVEG